MVAWLDAIPVELGHVFRADEQISRDISNEDRKNLLKALEITSITANHSLHMAPIQCQIRHGL